MKIPEISQRDLVIAKLRGLWLAHWSYVPERLDADGAGFGFGDLVGDGYGHGRMVGLGNAGGDGFGPTWFHCDGTYYGNGLGDGKGAGRYDKDSWAQ